MNSLVQFFKYSAVGILTILFLFPLLHELGHALAGLIVGANISNFSLYPMPECTMNVPSSNSIWIISLSGILSPYVFAILCNSKCNCKEVEFGIFLFQLQSMLSAAINVLLSILISAGQSFHGDDVELVFKYLSLPSFVIIGFFGFMFVLLLTVFLRRRPLLFIAEFYSFLAPQ